MGVMLFSSLHLLQYRRGGGGYKLWTVDVVYCVMLIRQVNTERISHSIPVVTRRSHPEFLRVSEVSVPNILSKNNILHL